MPQFGVRARRIQGAFRESSASISMPGRAPGDDKGRRHPHLLALGYEEENLFPPLRGPDGALAFFRNRGIQWWKSTRSGDNQATEGPTRNLASSQVSCLNFLLPLAQSATLTNALLRGLDKEEMAAIPVSYQRNGLSLSSFVEFEWVGLKTSLEGSVASVRGANVTSADALVLADLPDGGRRAYLLEWKYVEEYKADEFLGDGTKGDTRRRRYSQRFGSSNSPFRPNLLLDEWLYEPFYQIMRLLLLGQKMIDERELGATEASVIVVCPEENTAYRNRITSPSLRARFPQATSVLEVLQGSLRDPHEFRLASQNDLIQAIASSEMPVIHDWLIYHQERYGWASSNPGA